MPIKNIAKNGARYDVLQRRASPILGRRKENLDRWTIRRIEGTGRRLLAYSGDVARGSDRVGRSDLRFRRTVRTRKPKSKYQSLLSTAGGPQENFRCEQHGRVCFRLRSYDHRSRSFLYSPVVRLRHPAVGAFTTRINEPPDEGLYGPARQLAKTGCRALSFSG